MVDNQSPLDEFGLPRFISEDEREVTGKEPFHQIEINLLEQPAEIDKVRISFRSGISMIFEELWQTGRIICMIQTSKGQRQFAVYDPTHTGHNAMKVNAPIEIL